MSRYAEVFTAVEQTFSVISKLPPAILQRAFTGQLVHCNEEEGVN
jgi:hypothetical protein